MKVTVDGEVFEFDFSRITNVEGMAIERATGKTYMEWANQIKAGSMTALTALVWIIKKRQEPTLRFDDILFVDVTVDDGDEAATAEPDPTPAADPAA